MKGAWAVTERLKGDRYLCLGLGIARTQDDKTKVTNISGGLGLLS